MAQAGVASGSRLTGLHQQAEALADRLPPLLVAAERVAATIAQGVHGRRRVGTGETFWQFRPYQPGDATARIDWRQSARSSQLFLRDQEWEAAESVWLWADTSGSMAYSSTPRLPSKEDRALLLLLALASLLTRAGERIALLGDQRRPIGGRAAVASLCDRMSAHPTASVVPIQPLPRYARLVLISDFFVPLEDLRERLRKFVAMGIRGHLLQVLDPAEPVLPFGGRVRFEGLENDGAALIGNVESVRVRYRDRIEAHRQGLRELARSLGWTFAGHVTDHPPEPPLLALYNALSTKVQG
ncbi:MAG TPA: DUF58 domain-containing protein [Geminicoccaceae bacterium]|nr:DUF58 domain-containing protein [Geminicoccaceae bacterium]